MPYCCSACLTPLIRDKTHDILLQELPGKVYAAMRARLTWKPWWAVDEKEGPDKARKLLKGDLAACPKCKVDLLPMGHTQRLSYPEAAA